LRKTIRYGRGVRKKPDVRNRECYYEKETGGFPSRYHYRKTGLQKRAHGKEEIISIKGRKTEVQMAKQVHKWNVKGP